MKKYFNPEYKMEAVMSNDVITLSHSNQEFITNEQGKVVAVVDTFTDKTTNEVTGVVSADVSSLLSM